MSIRRRRIVVAVVAERARRHKRAVAALGTLTAAGALAVVAFGAPPEPGQPTEVLKWNQIAMSTLLGPPIGTMPGPAGGAPPAASIHLGMTQGAVYDAVNATEPKHYRPYLLKRRFSARASKNAAVATAAYEVLSSIVRGVPSTIAFPNRQALLDSLASAYDDSLDDIGDSPFKTQGIAAGHAAGRALEPAAAQRDDRTRPHTVGRRRKAVLARELVPVPHGRPAGAHQCRVRGRLQRGEDAGRRRRDDEHHAHAGADACCPLLDRRRRAVLERHGARRDR